MASTPPIPDHSTVHTDTATGSQRPATRGSAARATAVILSFDSVALIGASALAAPSGGAAIALVGLPLALLALAGRYQPRLNLRLVDDSWRLAECVFLASLGTALVSAQWATAPALARTALLAAAFLHLGRAAAYALIRELRKRRALAEPVVVVGAGQVATELHQILREHPEYGLIPVSLINANSPPEGGVALLGDAIRKLMPTRVIVGLSTLTEAVAANILTSCAEFPVAVYVVPRSGEISGTTPGAPAEDIWGFSLITVVQPVAHGRTRRSKRLFDLVIGSLLLVLSLPVFAVAPVAIRLSSPGPVFFRQKRIGENGRVIAMLKFRTLLCNDDSDETWWVGNDDRRTWIGRILRKTGLDELPQILNVLRGEMSLVGPRPERPYFADRFALEVPGYRDRQRAPQGITGWAQVQGLRGDTSIADRIRFDNYYIEHWSMWWDIRILAQTVPAMLGRRGA